MAAKIGSLDTRILIATGDSTPIEVGTVTTHLLAKRESKGSDSTAYVELNARSWRRTMTLAFLRMAWATLTMRNTRARSH